jgi:hypothetical protein
LLEVVEGLVRLESTSADEVVKKLAALRVFHDQIAGPAVREMTGNKEDADSSLPVSQTSKSRRTLGCSISFMMTISRSMPSKALSA